MSKPPASGTSTFFLGGGGGYALWGLGLDLALYVLIRFGVLRFGYDLVNAYIIK